ncbi:SprT-like domain-containing protein [Sulfurimonas sp. SAG-AH-194-I05]|nr:SprT-like domain-containing protein [Sulfurimonas sp. SAG-AH-194-I05]MDF1875555.1 SprT-like domain-containing protein [Sulfurimonas sp. SAG-AH-194-I05]
MFTKKLEIIFIIVILISLSILAKNYYDSYSFKNNAISKEYKTLIINKEREVLQNMKDNYGLSFQFPLIVTDKFQGRLYGLTSYKDGTITIYLNKKVMKESMDYIIESVIAHEYAHALMFKLGHFHTEKDGHSKRWKEICVKLGGKDCRQYVNTNEIIMSKMPFH